MTTELWLLVGGGIVFILLSTAGFLAAVAYGLKKGNWTGVLVIAVAWVVAMAAYSMWDSETRRDAARERAVETP